MTAESGSVKDDIPPARSIRSHPKLVHRGWALTGLVALAILVPALGLSLVIPFAVAAVGFAMVFAGPIYAAFYVPIAVRKWRRETPDDARTISPARDLIVSFGTPNQKLTMILSVILVVNLIVFAVTYLMPADTDLGYSTILIPTVAVCAGVPIFILNLVWIRSRVGIPAESIAVRNRIGAWRLITANRVLSLMVWCGYPAASIIGIAAGSLGWKL